MFDEVWLASEGTRLIGEGCFNMGSDQGFLVGNEKCTDPHGDVSIIQGGKKFD